MFRKIYLVPIVVLLVLAVGFIIKIAVPGQGSQSQEKIKVVATVYPVYEFARYIGGDRIDLVMLTPPGAEPHDWEPTAQDIIKIKKSKIFLYHGAGFESWVDRLLTKETLGNTVPVQVSKDVPILTENCNNNNDGHCNKDGHHKHSADSHIWLDPIYAKQEADNIAAALSASDSANAAYYRQNADVLKAELEKLHQEYLAALSAVSQRDIVTSHAAFGYLAKRYNLEQEAIMGLSPDAEPTPERMAAVVDYCRKHQVKYVFFETLVSPKVAETIAREAGAKVLVLNPLEGLTEKDVMQQKNYFSLMRENLTNLQTALAP